MERDKYIQAFARCRPLGSSEKQTSIRLCTDNNEIITNEKTFLFDRVFGSGASQRDVFDVVVKPLIYEVLQGYNCTVFAYGPTGTGKTYTMEGDIVNQHQCGLIPRAVEYFSNLNEVCEVKVSFLQIYNEDIYDLLSPVENSTKLKLFDDKGSVLINGLEELKIVEKDDIHHIMNNSSARRRTAATLLNACSSRSHTIFTIKVRMKERIGKLNLVDLAGSESIGRSGAQDKRAREAGSINQSLLTLGRVVTALVERRPHIPYRESKLTRILQDSLGGSTQTSMIATISPSDNDVANTLSTLDYAARARKICNQLDTHPNISLQRSSDQSEKELQALREELNNVEMRVRNEVAEEFREQNEKIQLINCESRKKLEEDYNRSIAGLVEKCRIAEELAESRAKVVEELEAKCIEKEAALRQAKVFEELADYRGTLVDEFEKKMREKEMEIITLKEENRQKDELIQTMSNVETTKKANRIREKVPPTEESNDYANITFDDTDEILKVSTKKARKNIVAGVKRKHINHTITLSGKKKRIQAANDCDEDDLSPVAPTRVTRSRATRKKLEY